MERQNINLGLTRPVEFKSTMEHDTHEGLKRQMPHDSAVEDL